MAIDIINNGPIGSGKFNPLKDILIDGVKITNLNTTNDKYKFYIRDGNDLTRWELAILKNCNIKFKNKINVDIFMVGGGKNGESGYYDSTYNYSYGFTGYGCRGGAGGNGGGIQLYSNILISSKSNGLIIIGDNDNNTSGFGKIAQSGTGFSGGGGAELSGNTSRVANAVPGTSSTYFAFLTQSSSCFFPNTLFGAGGGGAYCSGYKVGAGVVPNSGGSVYGGKTGGGNGGWASNDGNPGTPNTGGGGGGGGCTRNSSGGGEKKEGGAGGSGIIIIHPNNFAGWEESDFITINPNQE